MSDISSDAQKTPEDTDYVGEIWFYRETYPLFHEGLKKLRAKVADFEGSFEPIKAAFDIKESPIDDEVNHIDAMIEWGEKKLTDSSSYRIIVRTYYGDLRLLKAGGVLQVQELEQKRDEFLRSQRAVPKRVIVAIEEKIRQMKDSMEQGVLNGVKPADILFEIDESAERVVPPESEASQSTGVATPTIVLELGEIPIMDEELRSRCLGILKTRTEEAKDAQLDTVVREMSVILEDRVRTVADIQEKLIGEKLMATAFATGSPKLRFSDDADTQQSVYLLFKGYVGFVRNDVMHKLVTNYTRDRVYQLLGYVDYLLFILTQAQKPEASEASDSTMPSS